MAPSRGYREMTSRRNQDEPEEQADVIDDTHKC
jgi:hypothetical protein